MMAVTRAALAQQPAQAAADGGTDVLDISLDELLDTPIAFASATAGAQSQREAPGIITVITREEIHDLGARDLIDVLRYVPGFDFNADIEGTLGLSVRGIYALEGKALVMLDGMPLNDLSYGNVLFGNRDAVELIERIEIIRGPGSTVYGGFAELAVINIVTTSAVAKRVVASATYGQLDSAVGHANGSLLGSYQVGGVTVHGSIFSGYAVRSDQDYPTGGGTTVNLNSYSRSMPFTLNLGAEWKGLSAQVMYDDFAIDGPIPEDASQPVHSHHRHLFVGLKDQLDLGKYFTLNSFVRYQHMSSWEATDDFSLQYSYYFLKPIDRVAGGVSLLAKPTHWLRLLAGVTATYDTSTVPATTNPAIAAFNTYYDVNGNVTPTLSFLDVGAYAEGVVFTPVVNITAGGRVDYHSAYGTSFVPRVALTKELGAFHAKALAALAFRAPVFENISLFPKIQPETTTVFELEAGYQISSWLYVGANAFDNRVRNSIVYQIDAVGNATYLNAGTTGTHGIEVEARARAAIGYATLSYSFYQATVPGVTEYGVEGHPDLHLGIPAHKFTARGSIKVHPHLSIAPALIVFSERYGLEPALDGSGTAVLTRFAPTALVDLMLIVKDAGYEGLDITLGVHDLLGANYKFVAAYDGAGVNALPGPGREVLLRLTYRRDFL
jgi:outer membrane cobalamin receptor